MLMREVEAEQMHNDIDIRDCPPNYQGHEDQRNTVQFTLTKDELYDRLVPRPIVKG